MTFRNLLLGLVMSGALMAGASAQETPHGDEVVAHFAELGAVIYADAREGAEALEAAIDRLLAAPSDETLDGARKAWLDARPAYLQSEVFRFGNPVVDAWEGRVNAWPLDEGLIDYVDDSYGTQSGENDLFRANVIANESLNINGRPTDVGDITPALIANVLHEAGDIEANVASGYHAVEFLLWGQDLNFTDPGAGSRPATDFSLDNCTGGNCERRRAYLKAAAALLVADLDEMAVSWRDGGAARTYLLNLPTAQGLAAIVQGMGSLGFGELAGERMKLGLLLHDPEEEQDCFSDNTAYSHFFDALGIQNAYLGRYTSRDGRTLSGPSLSDLLAGVSPDLDGQLKRELDQTVAIMAQMTARTQKGEAYDQLIAAGNAEGNALVQSGIDALLVQTRTLERVAQELGLDIGSGLVDADAGDAGAVFQ